jgi:hypothetical protein
MEKQRIVGKKMVAKSRKSVCQLAALLVSLGGLVLSQGASAFDWKIGSTKVNLGGYVKLDVLYSNFSDGPVPQSTIRDFYVPSGTPIAPIGGSAHSYLDFEAKQTRLWLGTQTDFGEHRLGSYIEFDFESGQIPQTVVTSVTGTTVITATTGNKISTNAYNPALRRAYITFDNFLFGQDWTTFQNVDAYPETLDLIGASEGTVYVRQPVVRYTYGGLQLALETPETTVYPFRGVAAVKTDDNYWPDFVARYNHKTGFGDFTLAGLARMLKDANTIGGADDSSFGWGGSASGKVPVLGKDDIRFMFTGGKGIGRYLALGTLGDAVVDSSNKLETVWAFDGYVAYHHVWSEEWRSNVLVSAIWAVSPEFLGAASTRRTESALANVLYSPVSKMTLGGEFRFASRTDIAGDSGRLYRFQMSAQYTF